MSDSFILLYDDDTKIIDGFGELFEDLGTKLKLQSYSNINEFEARLQNKDLMNQTKCVICDLAKNPTETASHKFQIITALKKTHDDYRIPIFIHSANLEYFDDFKGEGTVFKVSKSGTAIRTICDKIALMDKTGFLYIFCPGGNIEKTFMTELHNAFIQQFKNNEIEEIINSIKESTTGDCKTRINQVFMRIALRALIHNITVPANQATEIKEIELNAIEHYYRRKSAYEVWTGDIFKKKDSTETLIVITPRCDVKEARWEQIHVCKIEPHSFSGLNKEKIRTIITDHPLNTGWKSRFLIKTPFYEGGKIEFPSHHMIQRNSLILNYNYIITLSDELINAIIIKFCAYISRSGISETEIEETMKYCEILLDNSKPANA
jgi:hypothetical protein